jgi:hypothetical protein
VPREFLDGARRRAAHRQVRTERVPQDVHALLRKTRHTLRTADRFDQAVARDRVLRLPDTGRDPTAGGEPT